MGINFWLTMLQAGTLPLDYYGIHIIIRSFKTQIDLLTL